jgi:hypothetical protein
MDLLLYEIAAFHYWSRSEITSSWQPNVDLEGTGEKMWKLGLTGHVEVLVLIRGILKVWLVGGAVMGLDVLRRSTRFILSRTTTFVAFHMNRLSILVL